MDLIWRLDWIRVIERVARVKAITVIAVLSIACWLILIGFMLMTITLVFFDR